jgi:TolA-binding protein
MFKKSYAALAVFFLLILISGCGQGADLMLFDDAEKTLLAGDYNGAIVRYSALVENHPESLYGSKSQYKIGYIHGYFLHDIKEAESAWAMLYRFYPESDEVSLAREAMGELYTQRGEYRKAVSEYEYLMEHGATQEHDRFQYMVAGEYIKMNDFTQARIEFQEILKNFPGSELLVEVNYGVAMTYYLEGSLTEAVIEFERVAFNFPDEPLALESRLLKASALTELGETAEALILLGRLKDEYSSSEVVKIRIESVEEIIKKGPKAVGKKR